MHRIKWYLIVVLALGTIAGCTKDETSSSVSGKISGNTWKLTYYWDKDKDETHKFSGYTFLFNADQSITANTGAGVVTGTWTFDTSDDSHDHFVISLPATEPLEDLNDDWEVIKITNAEIALKDVSGSGGTEYLTFKLQ
jgi:hypothetical protein